MTAPLRVDPKPARQRARREAAPEPRPRPHLTPVPTPHERRRRRRRSFAAAGVTFGLVLVFGVLAIHVMIAQTAFDLQRAQRHVSDARARNRELLVQVAELEAPGRIRHDAVERLHMQPPATWQYLHVPPRPPASVPLPNGVPTTTAPPANADQSAPPPAHPHASATPKQTPTTAASRQKGASAASQPPAPKPASSH